jgi:hypothetical protein
VRTLPGLSRGSVTAPTRTRKRSPVYVKLTIMREFSESWPPPETLLTRVQLARLLGVKRETLKAWDYRGKGPPKAAKGTFCRPGTRTEPALYRCGDVLEWLALRTRRPVEVAPGALDQPKPTPHPETTQVPPRHLDVLCRTEVVVNRMKEVERQDPSGGPMLPEPHTTAESASFGWRTLDDGDEPFSSNRRTVRPARYWGS